MILVFFRFRSKLHQRCLTGVILGEKDMKLLVTKNFVPKKWSGIHFGFQKSKLLGLYVQGTNWLQDAGSLRFYLSLKAQYLAYEEGRFFYQYEGRFALHFYSSHVLKK